MKLLAAVAITFGLCVGTKAEELYPVGGSAHGISGSGTVYASMNPSGDGSYTITGLQGAGVTGLFGPGGFHENDNQLFPNASTNLDSNGFAFTDTMGDTTFQVALFGNADGTYGVHVMDSDGVSIDDTATFMLGSSTTYGFGHQALVDAVDAPKSGTEAFTFSFAASQANTATPEPSSIALLGTGLLSAAGFMRKRV